jgi:hypothetical protein
MADHSVQHASDESVPSAHSTIRNDHLDVSCDQIAGVRSNEEASSFSSSLHTHELFQRDTI